MTYPDGFDKESKDLKKSSMYSWLGLIDIQELQIRNFEVLPRKHWLVLLFFDIQDQDLFR